MTGSGDGADSTGGSDEGSGLSRRKFVAGGLLFVGGSSLLVDSTAGRFADSDSASGTVRVDGDPALNYRIYDETKNNKARYTVAYQVEWITDFDRIEIMIDNQPDGQYSSNADENVSFTETSPEGTVSNSFGGGNVDDTFEFIFEVYRAGNTDPVIRKETTDEPDGNGSGEGDFGNSDSASLERITVLDNRSNNKAQYTVEYEASDTNFDRAVITFDNRTQNNWGNATRTSYDKPTGSASYSKGGTDGDTYHISVELKNANGLTVSSQTVEDVVDGTDSEWTA